MEKNPGLVTRAVIFAAKAHNGQLRKGTEIPYIVHPMEAAALAAGLTEDPRVIAAAVLHDTMEDTSVTREQIEKEFGERVAELVAAESENKREDQRAEDTWQIRKKESVKHLETTHDPDVKILALCDKLSNLRAIYRDLGTEGEKLWERFHQKDPEMIGWYYRSFILTCAELYRTAAYQEYAELVGKVFCRNPGKNASAPVLFCRAHLPLLRAILENPDTLEWCRSYTFRAGNRRHPELDRYFSAFISEAYRCGVVIPDYRELLEEQESGSRGGEPARPEERLREQDARHILARIAHCFRADYFDNGSLVAVSVGRGTLVRLMSAYLEKAELEP